MARLIKHLLGIPNGKIGPLMFKIRKGTPYIAMAPVKSTKPRSAKSIETNKKFGFVSSLAKSLSDDFFINMLWEKTEIKGETVRHKIISVNLSLVDADRNIDNIKIVPSDDLFEAVLLNAETEEHFVRLTFAPFNIPQSELFYPEISANGIMHMFNPVVEEDAAHYFSHIQSAAAPYTKGSSHTIIIPFNRSMMSRYNAWKIHVTLILENLNRAPEKCSGNVRVAISP
jgi:hypothetical protein